MTKNKIPFKHAHALTLLRGEREMLLVDLASVKKQINHMQFLRMNEPDDFEYFRWESIYMGGVSKLTKRQNQWKKDLKSIDESIKLLKEDGQRDHERQFQLAQAEERAKREGSYNCMYGC